MKRFSFLVLLLVFLILGCAHRPAPAPSASYPSSAPPAQPEVFLAVSGSAALTLKSSEVGKIAGSTADRKNLQEDRTGPSAEAATIADSPESWQSSPKIAAQSGTGSTDGREDLEGKLPGEEKEMTAISDPLEPFNRAMFHFNDKLYFWVLKPVAQGYNQVVPEPARVGVQNFFSNLRMPVRFVSSLLQGDVKGAATQLGRFLVNTIWGVGGLLDPASSEQLDMPKQDADLGQTLGIYGVGQGFYLVWPILGPSSARDSVGLAGDFFLYPVSYINPWYDWLAVRSYEEVNAASLRIGDYEALKEAAIDPYVAIRNAYQQYRQKKVEAGRGQPLPPNPAGAPSEEATGY
ncbi:MAG: VacJ family lipoprotein [Deltaproteobacteria bacterium]|nr:VacJ family lipoprotein [Deltaproteobacteria bacterium]